jgi:YD repeat-containing protein
VIGFDGYAEMFEYQTAGGSPSEHALTSVDLPGESKVFMEYDESGRLSSIFR